MLHVVAFATALIFNPPAAVTDLPNIRTTNPLLAALIAEARAQSPTFAEMLDQLERSDVIVYFEGVPRFDRNLRGCVHFMGASAGYRYIRAQIRTMMNRYDIVASLAHELQHAIEISHHPDVRTEADLAQLYKQIGDERERLTFETNEAQSAGRAVRSEVLGSL
jgi:hypothetical protein